MNKVRGTIPTSQLPPWGWGRSPQDSGEQAGVGPARELGKSHSAPLRVALACLPLRAGSFRRPSPRCSQAKGVETP